MAYETEALFREDSYLSTAEGTVLAMTDTGGSFSTRRIFMRPPAASRDIGF